MNKFDQIFDSLTHIKNIFFKKMFLLEKILLSYIVPMVQYL